jgi:hypothetical protein
MLRPSAPGGGGKAGGEGEGKNKEGSREGGREGGREDGIKDAPSTARSSHTNVRIKPFTRNRRGEKVKGGPARGRGGGREGGREGGRGPTWHRSITTDSWIFCHK